MKVKFLFFLFILCLGVSGCADEYISQPMEMVFFEGGDAGEAAESTVTGVSEDMQVLLWGDRDALEQELLDWPESYAELGVAFGYGELTGAEARREWLLDQIRLIDAQRAYYTKYIGVGGLAIIGHDSVSDAHFYTARDIFLTMTSKRPELRDAMAPPDRHKFRMLLFDNDVGGENPTMPEFPNGFAPGGGCGYDFCASIAGSAPILTHEFAHAIHYAIRRIDPTFQARLEAAHDVAYANAFEAWDAPGSATNRYTKQDHAMTNPNEYWAMGVGLWFEYVALDFEWAPYHDEFLELDPLLYALMDEWLPLVDMFEIVGLRSFD